MLIELQSYLSASQLFFPQLLNIPTPFTVGNFEDIIKVMTVIGKFRSVVKVAEKNKQESLNRGQGTPTNEKNMQDYVSV